jgi:predicted dehydrogenase
VLITAGAAVHAPLALTALAAGKHVLVEKPFAPTLLEAQAVVEAAAAQGRVLMVSQNYRHFPAPWAVRDLIAEGALGEVGSVYVDFRVDMTRRLPAGHPYLALYEPLLLDMAIHHFDLMRFTLGQEPSAVTCSSWNPPGSAFTYAPSAAATVRMAEGATVAYRGSWLGAPKTLWAGEWRLEGAKGRLSWTSRKGGIDDLSGERVTLRGRTLPLPTLPRLGRRGVLTEFADAVATGREPLSSGAHNLGTLELTLGAIASAAEGRSLTFRP